MSEPAEGVHALSVPTPFAVGPVNCYLIEDDPLTLVDCGPNSGTALEALEAALARRGRRVEDLGRVVVTHQHMDHVGLLGLVARRSGAEVCALDLLAPVLEDYPAAAEADDQLAEALMLRHGVPRDVVRALRSVSRAYRAWGDSSGVHRRLRDGERLPFRDRLLEVAHRPGHSPSDTVFWDPERRVLIGGDHLLGHISSNPLIQRALGGRSGDPAARRPRALELYLASLRETRELPARVVLPGHGEPVSDPAQLIDERFAGHERRAAKLAELIAAEPRTAHELAHALWGNVAVTQAYLTLSEVLGHLDLLERRGAVGAQEEEGGVVRYVPTDS